MWRKGGSFAKLSGPDKPNAKHLWFYLLTGDTGTSLPGVLVVDREILVLKLGWSGKEKAFDKCVEEIARSKMAAFDFEGGMIFCPAALNYNRPQSPNVIVAWGKAFDMLPEGDLKGHVWQAIAELVEELAAKTEKGEAFPEAFRKAFPKAYGDSSEASGQGFLYSVSDSDSVTASDEPKATLESNPVQPGEYDKSPEFGPIWEIYPNGKGKQVAHRAWIKAIQEKRIVLATEEAAEEIPDEAITQTGLRMYLQERAVSDSQWLKDDGQFVPMLSTFLNQSLWTDRWKKGRQRTGEAPASRKPTTVQVERKLAVKGILTYCSLLLEADLPDEVVPMAKAHAKELREICDDAKLLKGPLLAAFYNFHDEFQERAYAAMTDEDRAKLDEGRHPQAKKETWRRKRMRDLFQFPDPLDVDPEDG